MKAKTTIKTPSRSRSRTATPRSATPSSVSPPVRQCTAKSKTTGQRCKRRPIPGGTVCKLHGGGAPQTRAAAQRRLLELLEPALAGLARALESKDVSAVVRAATAVLDRVGFHAKTSVEWEDVTEPEVIPLSILSTETKRRIVAEIRAARHGVGSEDLSSDDGSDDSDGDEEVTL